jgi:hypothetical protein
VENYAGNFPPKKRSPQRSKKFRFRAIASGDENRNEGGILTDCAQSGKQKLAAALHGRSQDSHRFCTSGKSSLYLTSCAANGVEKQVKR